MKWSIRIVAGVLIVLIVAALVFVLVVDGMTRSTIERNAQVALDVNAQLDSAGVRILGGRLDLNQFDVSNPEGFDETPRFMMLGHATTDLSLFDLPRQRIELDRLELENIHVYLERKEGGANYHVILDNLRQYQDRGDPERKKDLFIREVVLRDITVSVRLLPMAGEWTRIEMEIPEITVDNVGTGDDGVSLPKLAGVITTTVLAGIFRQGADILPADMLEELGTNIAALGDLGQYGMTIAGETFSDVVDLISTVAEGLGVVGEEILEGVGDTIQDIGDIFRRRDEN